MDKMVLTTTIINDGETIKCSTQIDGAGTRISLAHGINEMLEAVTQSVGLSIALSGIEEFMENIRKGEEDE